MGRTCRGCRRAARTPTADDALRARNRCRDLFDQREHRRWCRRNGGVPDQRIAEIRNTPAGGIRGEVDRRSLRDERGGRTEAGVDTRFFVIRHGVLFGIVGGTIVHDLVKGEGEGGRGLALLFRSSRGCRDRRARVAREPPEGAAQIPIGSRAGPDARRCRHKIKAGREARGGSHVRNRGPRPVRDGRGIEDVLRRARRGRRDYFRVVRNGDADERSARQCIFLSPPHRTWRLHPSRMPPKRRARSQSPPRHASPRSLKSLLPAANDGFTSSAQGQTHTRAEDMRLAGIEPATLRSGGARSIP